jgi:flagellar basal body-associated protein FliL
MVLGQFHGEPVKRVVDATTPTKMETKRPSRTPLLASVVVVVILAAGLGYLYVSSSQTESALNSTISSQQSQIGAQSATIQSQSATISALSGSVSTLQANVTAYRSLVASLNTMLKNDQAQVATLTAKLTTANSTIATDASTIASLNSQINLARSIEANYTHIISLAYSKTLVSNQATTIYGTTHTSSTPFVTFSPAYAGYVLISVSAYSESFILNSTAKPANLNTGGAVYEALTFLAPSTSTSVNYVILAVSPGTMNSFALLTTSSTDGTATVTATYYY